MWSNQGAVWYIASLFKSLKVGCKTTTVLKLKNKLPPLEFFAFIKTFCSTFRTNRRSPGPIKTLVFVPPSDGSCQCTSDQPEKITFSGCQQLKKENEPAGAPWSHPSCTHQYIMLKPVCVCPHPGGRDNAHSVRDADVKHQMCLQLHLWYLPVWLPVVR